jgi:hypothetical protein
MSSEQAQPSRRRSLLFIIIAVVLVLLALYVATQVVSVLFGIIMPPSPPLPNGVRETSHVSSDYGVDSWAYASDTETCDLVLFYEVNGGVCFLALGQCGREGTEQVSPPAVAQCVGSVPFSIFHMQWSAELFRSGENGTRIELNREVFWIGTGPTTTPQFDIGQLSPSPNATSER